MKNTKCPLEKMSFLSIWILSLGIEIYIVLNIISIIIFLIDNSCAINYFFAVNLCTIAQKIFFLSGTSAVFVDIIVKSKKKSDV